MEKDQIRVGDRVVFRGFYGNVKQFLSGQLCMLRLDSGHLIAATIGELRLVERSHPTTDDPTDSVGSFK